ncbi:hypothetical protein F4811DRAFT_550813 [Daldinia bambusicola]|nr:hypothetical protein F4811DRAFT_550813 [Daldinia bambusicola]
MASQDAVNAHNDPEEVIHRWIVQGIQGNANDLDEYIRRAELADHVRNSEDYAYFVEYIKSNDSYESVAKHLAELQQRRARPRSQQTTSHGEHPSTQIEQGQTTTSDHESDVDLDTFHYGNDAAPLTAIHFRGESVVYHWRYRYDYIPWVKRIWSALDPQLPAMAKDAAAMILLGNVNVSYIANSVVLYVNNAARFSIQGKEHEPVPRLFLAILQAMALSNERAKAHIYKLVPSLKPEEYPADKVEGHLSSRSAWHWGSSSSAVEVYPLTSLGDFSQTSASIDLTDEFLWPVEREAVKYWGAPGVELVCFDKICRDWNYLMKENSRESNPVWYKPCVSLEERADSADLVKVTRAMAKVYTQLEKCRQLAAKYKALTDHVKLMVDSGCISKGTIDELINEIERNTI